MKPMDLLILGIVIGAILVYYLIKIVNNYKLKRQLRVARRAERAAQYLLQQQGYKILAVQKRVPVVTKVDGRKYKNHVKVDFIVKKDRLRYVVEVKTGAQVKRPTNADIRRQLLEYYLIYRTDGILLVDMENKAIHTIEFEIKQPRCRYQFIYYLAAMAAGAFMTLIIAKGGLGI